MPVVDAEEIYIGEDHIYKPGDLTVISVDAPIVEYTAKSTFHIANPQVDVEYYLGNASTGSLEAGIRVNPNSFTASYSDSEQYVYAAVWAETNPSNAEATTFTLKKVTQTSTNNPIWIPCTPPPAYSACCNKCDGSDPYCCWGGSPCSDGHLCCHSCSGGHTEDNWTTTDDPTPAGFTKANGEWYKIDNPAGAFAVHQEESPFYVGMEETAYVAYEGIDPEDDPIITLTFFDGDEAYRVFSYPQDLDRIGFVFIDDEPQLRFSNMPRLRKGSRWEAEAYVSGNKGYVSNYEQQDISVIWTDSGTVA